MLFKESVTCPCICCAGGWDSNWLQVCDNLGLVEIFPKFTIFHALASCLDLFSSANLRWTAYGIPCLPDFSFPSTDEPCHEYILEVGKHHVTTGINQHKYYIEHDTESGDAGERLWLKLINSKGVAKHSVHKLFVPLCLPLYRFFLLINAARTNLDYHSQNYENIFKALGHYPPLSKADATTSPGSMCGGDNLKFMWKCW